MKKAAKHHVSGAGDIRSVPINRIRVLNPRSRDKKIFAGLVESIATIGLKRPIEVAEVVGEDGPRYHLVCGQGRLEAFQALGETEIPAIVVEASEADLFLMSLIENCARRKHSNRDLLTAVRVLEERGYSGVAIAEKTGLDPSYIHGILILLKGGEERLIAAVEKGWLPMTIATEIAKNDDATVQVAMMEAYDSGLLHGDQFKKIRQLIDRRRFVGKRYDRWNHKIDKEMTPRRLLQTYETEMRRQQRLVKKAELNEGRLYFVVSALRKLLADEHFRTLLRAENIGDMPKTLADRLLAAEGRP